MGLGDGASGDSVSDRPEKYPICNSCNTAISSKSLLITTVCNHTYHKDCLSKCLKIRPYCPICNTRIVSEGSQKNTRAQSKLTAPISESQNTSSIIPAESVGLDNPLPGSSSSDANLLSSEALRNMISSMMATQQSQLLSTLSDQISRLVETSVRNSFSALNSLNPGNPHVDHQQNVLTTQQQIRQSDQPLHTSSVPPQILRTPPHLMPNVAAVEHRTFREFLGIDGSGTHPRSVPPAAISSGSPVPASALSELSVRPDKVLQIISNWRIKFNGGQNGLSVEHFIYRVEALTRQTLNNDYNLLCSNAGLLFEGKADCWFWRYHMSVPSITWPELCVALKKQYKDSRTDIDIRELIRDRKQKVNESFDCFYETIVSLTDRLVEPLHEKSLVEILRRNLLPEIQHEILNLKIDSVEELRDICRRREFFIQDMRRKHGVQLSKPLPRRVAEIIHEFEDEVDNQNVEIEEIAALALNCWNCQKPGHRYQDCLAERTIFCYGCGKPDTYKPNCTKCNSKNLKASASTAPRNAQRPMKQLEMDLE